MGTPRLGVAVLRTAEASGWPRAGAKERGNAALSNAPLERPRVASIWRQGTLGRPAVNPAPVPVELGRSGLFPPPPQLLVGLHKGAHHAHSGLFSPRWAAPSGVSLWGSYLTPVGVGGRGGNGCNVYS